MTISKNIIEDLDKLVRIGKKYRENTITESMFQEVIYNLKNDSEASQICRKYLLEHGIQTVNGDTDVEDMDENYNEEVEIRPYDPSDIDISLKSLSLSLIIDRLEMNEIDLMPDFQRKGGLWSEEQKSRLIESLILRIPLPAFYFDGSYNDRWVVIDGLQRLTAIKEFFVEQSLSLSGLEFLNDLNGVHYEELPRVYKRRMKETQIITYIINPGAPVNLKYNIFKRINTGGLSLEPQEIRHALYQGFATKYLKELAALEEFKIATGYSVKSERMLDREFALRFIAFYELGIEKYKGSIDFFLNDAMEYINKSYNQEYADAVKQIYIRSLVVAYKIFERFAFRKMPDMEKRRPVNKALFEVWTVSLARRSEEEIELLIKGRKKLQNKFMKLCNEDKEFDDSLKSAKIGAVKRRFERIEKLMKEVLED